MLATRRCIQGKEKQGGGEGEDPRAALISIGYKARAIRWLSHRREELDALVGSWVDSRGINDLGHGVLLASTRRSGRAHATCCWEPAETGGGQGSAVAEARRRGKGAGD